MNKNCVALAADSAVTMTNQKILNTADKIFQLSKFHPVGIMIYSNSSFMNIPWEILIKDFREKLNDKNFDTIEIFTSEFLKYLENCDIITQELKEDFIEDRILEYSQSIASTIDDFIKDEIINKLGENLELIKDLAEKEIENMLNEIFHDLKSGEMINYKEKFSYSDFNKNYHDIIDEVLQSIINLNLINDNSKLLIYQIIHLSFESIDFIKKSVNFGNGTGIVVTGYGKKEYFPSIRSVFVDGIYNNQLRYYIEEKDSILPLNGESGLYAFAQSEMVSTFVYGINPDFNNKVNEDVRILLENIPEKVLNFISGDKDVFNLEKFKEVLKNEYIDYLENLNKYQEDNYLESMLDILSIFTKEEMAFVAETLVNFTSFRRKVSKDAETVGGPIDVAIISKFDGFIWKKRKFYFKKKYNPYFTKNYYRRN